MSVNPRLVTPVRAFTLACAALVAPLSAHAQLYITIPTNALQANSVQAFSSTAQTQFNRLGIAVTPLGNATAVAGQTAAYNLPVTSITLDFLSIASGGASGSALEFDFVDDNNANQRLTLANFNINFQTGELLADATPLNGPTVKQTSIFSFNVESALALKYQFPLTITGNETLNKLFVTSSGKATMISALNLPVFAQAVLGVLDFGTITINVDLAFRNKPVSAKPYVVGKSS